MISRTAPNAKTKKHTAEAPALGEISYFCRRIRGCPPRRTATSLYDNKHNSL